MTAFPQALATDQFPSLPELTSDGTVMSRQLHPPWSLIPPV